MTEYLAAPPPQPTSDRRIVQPNIGDQFTFINRDGEARRYEVKSAETNVSFAAVVRLTNVDTGKDAWVTKHWMTFARPNGRWEAGWFSNAETAEAA